MAVVIGFLGPVWRLVVARPHKCHTSASQSRKSQHNELVLKTKWTQLLRKSGVTFNPSAADTQSQNSFAERAGRILVTIAHKLFIASNLPKSPWNFFIKDAMRLANETPIQRKDWITPH